MVVTEDLSVEFSLSLSLSFFFFFAALLWLAAS